MNNNRIEMEKYTDKFSAQVNALFDSGKLSEKLKDEYYIVLENMAKIFKNTGVFLDFMNAVSPNDMEGVIIPEEIIMAIDDVFPAYSKINFSVSANTAAIYIAYNATKSFSTILSERYLAILDEIAEIDADFANTLLCYKAFMSDSAHDGEE